MSRNKTHEEYVTELAIKNPNIKVIGIYNGMKNKISHRCLIHNIYWDISPNDAIRGCGCYKCKSDKIKIKRSKTHAQYVEELKSVNPNIVAVDNYSSANVRILHRCLVDDYEWMATPANILSGFGCPKCSKRFRRTHNEYVQEVSKLNEDVEVVGVFTGLQTPILHRCKLHKIEWMTTPENILKGCGCSECKKDKIKDKNSKTHEQYVGELKILNPNIEALDIYVNALTPIKHKCLIDGYEWLAAPGNILYGYGCPKCNSSKGEKSISQWLDDNQIEYISQKKFDDCKDIRTLPFDFYLPDYNLCIEYDGEQHFKPVNFGGISDEEASQNYKTTVQHDQIKNEFCKNNNISLLRIPFYENPHEILNNFLFN